MKTYMSIAVMALLSNSSAHRIHHPRQYVQFIDGDFDSEERVTLSQAVQRNTQRAYDPSGVVVQRGNIMAQSDPIAGSLGHPAVDINTLNPEQAFEENQRRMPPAKYEDDQE